MFICVILLLGMRCCVACWLVRSHNPPLSNVGVRSSRNRCVEGSMFRGSWHHRRPNCFCMRNMRVFVRLSLAKVQALKRVHYVELSQYMYVVNIQ